MNDNPTVLNKIGPTILLSNGAYFDFLDPEKPTYGIKEVAHALSHLCRFTGHCSSFYSVAQHSVLVSTIVPRKFALAGLLHDAAEAFLGDVAKPLKVLLPDYRRLEARIEAAVLRRFGVEGLDPCIKQADLILLATERRDLMPHCGTNVWTVLDGIKPMADRIIPWNSTLANAAFIQRFRELGGVS